LLSVGRVMFPPFPLLVHCPPSPSGVWCGAVDRCILSPPLRAPLVLGGGKMIFPTPPLWDHMTPLHLARYMSLRVCPLEVIYLDIAACAADVVIPNVIFVGKTNGLAEASKEIAHSKSDDVSSYPSGVECCSDPSRLPWS
jgi:hypothetical protein